MRKAVWAAAPKQTRKLDRIAQGWHDLMTFIGAGLNQRYALLHTADVDPATWMDLELTGQHLNPWDALSAGLPLSLLTLSEYRARVAAIEAASVVHSMPQLSPERVHNQEWAAKTDAARKAQDAIAVSR